MLFDHQAQQKIHSLFSCTTPRHSAPQRCLVSLIQINKLKTDLEQLKQYIFKQMQTMKNGLSLVSIGCQGVNSDSSQELISTHTKSEIVYEESKKQHNKQTMIQQLKVAINVWEKEQAKNEEIIKKQIENIKSTKMEHRFEIQKMNIKINQLYSIVRMKNQQILKINQQVAALKKQKYLMTGIRKSLDKNQKSKSNSQRKQGQQINLKVIKKYNRAQSKSSSKGKYEDQLGNRFSISSRQSRNQSLFKRDLGLCSQTPLKEISFSTETAQRIGDIICSLTDESSILQKQLRQIDFQNKQKKPPIKKSNSKPALKSSSLNEVFKSAMKTFNRNQKLFK